ncbi:MAG: thioredoxin family protein [Phycisphaerae bacterium]|nr:thioredoxin family protein [Phycisphaerae bacterium]
MDRLLFCGIVIAACLVARADLPPAFSDLTLDAAKKQVDGTDKVVVVKFTADWCPPCKAMDKTTWRDESVVKWVKDHGVAIQVDVDKDQKTAQAYNIEAMPTMVMLRGGKEIGRKVGYMDPKQTLSWMESGASGKPAEPAMDPNLTPVLRLNARLQSALDEKRYSEAAAIVGEIWSKENAEDPMRRGGAAAPLFTELKEFSSTPEGKRAITAVRDSLEKKLKRASREDFGTLRDWITFNELLQDDARSLAWFDRVKSQDGVYVTFRQTLDLIDPLLIRNDRWADLATVFADPPAWARQMYRLRMRGVEDLNKLNPGLGDLQLVVFEQQAARIYAGQLLAGKAGEADEFAKTMLELRATPTMRVAMVEESLNAGAPTASADLWLGEAEKAGADVSALRKRLAERPKK